MNAAHLLAPLIQTVAILLHEGVAESFYYKHCDLSMCSLACRQSGALRWSCEEEGCLCTFRYEDDEIWFDELVAHGKATRRGNGNNRVPPDFYSFFDIERGIAQKPKRPKKKHRKYQGRNMPENRGKKGQRYDQEVKLQKKASSEQGDNDVDVKVEAKNQNDALGLGPMARLALEGDRKDKFKVKSSKKAKSQLPFVVMGRHRSLSTKEVMDQIKKQKGAYPIEKIRQFIKTGGRR